MAKHTQTQQIVPIDPAYRNKLLLVTGAAGLVFGLMSGLMLIKNVEKTGSKIEVSGREGLQLALLIFGTLRSISNLWEE